MSEDYEIRLYDEPLLSFEMTSDSAFGLSVGIKQVSERVHLLPLGMEVSNDGVLKWLERRVIPKNRTFVSEILQSLGLTHGDVKGIIDVCKGLSLNDSYWVVPQGFGNKFADCNLYENRFSEILSLVAYTGITQSDAAFTTSPELTTNGMLPKAWRLTPGDGIYLYKGGTTGFANGGREPYCEFYASQIAEVMGVDAIHYDIENWKGIVASKCKLFTDIDTAYIPIGRIVPTGGLAAVNKFFADYGFLDELRDMLVYDALIYNQDRHYGNFGVLRDNRTGKILRPAPLFDHGISLFGQAMPDDYANLKEYSKKLEPPYPASTFEGVCREFITNRQASMLRKVLHFTFKRHKNPKLNLPEEHLHAIETQIQRRVLQLLNLDRRK
jgi:hypothetical protein